MIEAFESRFIRSARWLLALVLGLALHAAVVAAALRSPSEQEPDDDFGGMIALELAPLAVASAPAANDAPLGPTTEDTVAAPATPVNPESARAEDVPELPETPYAPNDNDLAFAKHKLDTDNEESPPDDKTTEVAEAAMPLPAAAPVEEATAPPPTTAAAAQNAVAQQIGITESQRKAIERWQRQVVVHLSKFKRYPVEARAKRIEGDATLSFAIDRFGRITRRDVVARSGSQVLDSAALAVLERAGNLPPPPAEVSGDTFDLVLPIEFRIKN